MKTKIILILVSIFLVFNISFSASVRTRKRAVTSNIKQKIVNTQWKLIKILSKLEKDVKLEN